jgi:hypothetical protein
VTQPIDETPAIDPDARLAVEAELGRLHNAEHFDPDAVTSGSVDRAPYVPPLPVVHRESREPLPDRQQIEPREERASVRIPREPKILEDLYALYPEIGNGVYHLRVERKLPTNYMGYAVSGWLCDLHEQPTFEEFAGRFGGARYLVSVIGPAKVSSRADASEPPKMTTLAQLDLKIHGPPAYGTHPRDEEQEGFMMRVGQSTGGRVGPLGFVPDPQVEIRRLEIEAEERKRADDARRDAEKVARGYQDRLVDAAHPPDNVIDLLRTQAENRVSEVKGQSDKLTEMLREQNVSLIRVNEALQQEMRTLRDDILRVKTEAAEQLRSGETKTITELKERHGKELVEQADRRVSEVGELKDRLGREMSELRQRHHEELQRVNNVYETKMNDASRNYLERMADCQSRADKEISTVRQDARERTEAMKADFDRRETAQRDAASARMADLERQTKREIDSNREQYDRQMASMTSQHASETRFTEKTADVQLRTIQTENAQFQTKLDLLEKENRLLRDKLTKDVPTAIAEAHHLAGMTGMVRADEVPAAKDDEEFDWKKQGMKFAMSLAEKSPELLQKLGELRQQGAQQAAARPPMAPPPAVLSRGLPPMVRQAPPPPRRVAPPPGMPPAAGVPVGVPPPFVGPPVPIGPVNMQAPRPAVVMAPTLPTGPVAPPAGGLGPAVNDPSSPVRPPPVPQAQPSQASAPSALPLVPTEQQQQQVAEFMTELDQAIAGKVVSPVAFANLFIGRVGPQVAAHLLTVITPEYLIQVVNGLPGGGATQIVTREGQKYVHAVWTESARVLGLPSS